MGAIPATVLTLLARPLPANARRPAASCTSTHESAEKLKRRRAWPTPAAFCSGAPAGAGFAAAAAGGVDGNDADVGDGRDAGAEAASAPAEFAALSASDALGVAAGGWLCNAAVPRWCQGFHQSTPRISSTAATEPTICGKGKLLTAGASSVRSLTLAGCAAGGSGACTRVS